MFDGTRQQTADGQACTVHTQCIAWTWIRMDVDTRMWIRVDTHTCMMDARYTLLHCNPVLDYMAIKRHKGGEQSTLMSTASVTLEWCRGNGHVWLITIQYHAVTFIIR